MNILITHSWLKDYLRTEATPEQVAKYLSLCSQSVERVTHRGNDTIYEIEITTNRPDCLSVIGIARELAVILPQNGIKATFVDNMPKSIAHHTKSLPLHIKIENPSLCPRFSAIIFDNVQCHPSPKTVKERLENVGIRSLNNVIDISNYLMVDLGQPMHTFDYDKIGKSTMLLRESRVNETIVTLDGQTRKLPKGVIVIEDGNGRTIDLCGIMGGENSAVDKNTKRVLLFVQTYDPSRIRKACQALSFRTDAAARFERGVDPEGVIPAIKKAKEMFYQIANGKPASKIIDIYPDPQKFPSILFDLKKSNNRLGTDINAKKATAILKGLGFTIKNQKEGKMTIVPPHWRLNDIAIQEDITEEVARIWGYHNLPNILPPLTSPQASKDPLFESENKIKDILKGWGFYETYNYSLIGDSLLSKLGLPSDNLIRLSNPLTEDLTYMRTSIIPSLIEVVQKNAGGALDLFEIANIYLPNGLNSLPEEKMTLAIITNNKDFFQTKGLLEGLLSDLNAAKPNYTEHKKKNDEIYQQLFHPYRCADIKIGKDVIGIIGELAPTIIPHCERTVALEIDIKSVINHIQKTKKYHPLSSYPPIIEDLSFNFPPKNAIGNVITAISKIDPLIAQVELIDIFQDTRTLRVTYQNPKSNLTEETVKIIRKRIITQVEKEFSGKLKTQEDN